MPTEPLPENYTVRPVALPSLLPLRHFTRGQVAWLILAALGTALWVGAPLFAWSNFATICHPDAGCDTYQLDAAAVHVLTSHGLSLDGYMILTAAIMVVVWAVWYGVSALIIWRHPANRGAMVTAYLLVLITLSQPAVFLNPGPVSNELGTVFLTVVVLFCLLFPTGRFAARWTPLVAVWTIVVGGLTSLPVHVLSNGPLGTLLYLLLFGSVAYAQVYRYRHRSSWVERQQIKWVVLGQVLALAGIFVIYLPKGLASFPTGSGSLFFSLVNTVGTPLAITAIPIAIGFAILSSGLWEIDRVINRALVYTALTAVLAGVYVGCVLGLGVLFRLVMGGSSALAVAISTLAIAALFGPLRQSIQTAIDRRFYQSKYDAQRTLASFGGRLRDEVDLSQLSHELTTVVDQTLHPASMALWLRNPHSPDHGNNPG